MQSSGSLMKKAEAAVKSDETAVWSGMTKKTSSFLILLIVGIASLFAAPFIAMLVLTIYENSVGEITGRAFEAILGITFAGYITVVTAVIMVCREVKWKRSEAALIVTDKKLIVSDRPHGVRSIPAEGITSVKGQTGSIFISMRREYSNLFGKEQEISFTPCDADGFYKALQNVAERAAKAAPAAETVRDSRGNVYAKTKWNYVKDYDEELTGRMAEEISLDSEISSNLAYGYLEPDEMLVWAGMYKHTDKAAKKSMAEKIADTCLAAAIPVFLVIIFAVGNGISGTVIRRCAAVVLLILLAAAAVRAVKYFRSRKLKKFDTTYLVTSRRVKFITAEGVRSYGILGIAHLILEKGTDGTGSVRFEYDPSLDTSDDDKPRYEQLAFIGVDDPAAAYRGIINGRQLCRLSEEDD